MKLMRTLELLESRQLLTVVTTLGPSMEQFLRPGPISHLQDGDTAYFVLLNGERQLETWQSDGTPEGTQIVGGSNFVSSGLGNSLIRTSAEVAEFLNDETRDVQQDELIPFRDGFAFVDLNTSRIWTSDDTVEGTRPVSEPLQDDDVRFTQFERYDFEAIDEALYVTESGNTELRKWSGGPDGTGVTTTVHDFTDGVRFTDVEVRQLANKVWVRVMGDSDSQLWTLDPETDEPALIRDWTDRSISWNDVAETNDGSIVFTAGAERGESYGSVPTYEFLHREVWISDGTTEGTEVLITQDEGMIVETLAIESDLYYIALAADGNYDLMRLADGDAAPEKLHEFTRLVRQFDTSLASVGSSVYFVDGSDVAGEASSLFRYDNADENASVELMRTFANGIAWSFQESPSGLMFMADDGGGDGIWITNGTAEGTQLLQHRSIVRQGATIRELTPTDDHLLLTTIEIPSSLDNFISQMIWSRDSSGSFELIAEMGVRLNLDSGTGTAEDPFSDNWVTDGTRAGTQFQSYGDPLPDEQVFGPSPIDTGKTATIGDTTFTVEQTEAHGTELFVTTNGESRLLDILPGERSSAPEGLTAIDGVLYFSAHDRTSKFDVGVEVLVEHNRELWRSDGTEEGTFKVIDLNPRVETAFVSSNSSPRDFRPVERGFIFTASPTGSSSRAWYGSDGTEEGTIRLELLDQSVGVESLGDESTALFVGPQGVVATDGSVEGTNLVAALPVTGDVRQVVLLANKSGLLHSATRHTDGVTIWTTNGTAGGTQELATIPSASSVGPLSASGSLADSDSRVFFVTNSLDGTDPSTQTLWVVDEGVVRSIATHESIFRSNFGTDFVEQHRQLYRVVESGEGYVPNESDLIFQARSIGELERRIWVYDGQSSPYEIEPIADLPHEGFFHAGNVYFSVEDEEIGSELWVTDGTQNGTFVYDISPGELSSGPRRWVLWKGDIYFTASMPVGPTASSGHQLWQVGEPELDADLNNDDVVDFSDFLTLSVNYGKENVKPEDGDTNADGVVDFADFLELSTTFGDRNPVVAQSVEPVQRNFENVEAIFAAFA